MPINGHHQVPPGWSANAWASGAMLTRSPSIFRGSLWLCTLVCGRPLKCPHGLLIGSLSPTNRSRVLLMRTFATFTHASLGCPQTWPRNRLLLCLLVRVPDTDFCYSPRFLSQMTSASNNAEQLILSSRQSLVSFNTLTHPSEHLERTFKMEPVDNPGGKERKRKVEPGTPSLFAYSVAEFDECSRCEKARSAGLDAWMDHLGHVHTFPSRWPSSKIDDGLMDKDRPYTSVVDSHKKRKAAGIPRPLNSFMVSFF